MSRAAPRLCVALACTLAMAAGFDAGPARAESRFGEFGSEAGQFNEPNGIAIDQDSGDVYVLDTNNNRVEEFGPDGAFLLAWGWGVVAGNTGLGTCTAASGCSPGTGGAGAGQLSFSEGIAVDNDPRSPSYNDVYVIDIFNHRVQEFSPTGRFLLTFGGNVNKTAFKHKDVADEDVCPVAPGDECGEADAGRGNGEFEFHVEGNFITVGPNGTVYVGDRNRIEAFGADGVYQSTLTLTPKIQDAGEQGGTVAIAVDEDGDLYVVRNGISGVQEYTPQGVLLRTFNAQARPENSESPTPALTVDPEGDLFLDYNVEEQHRVLEFDAAGVEVASFDEGMPDGLHGLAYGDLTSELYIVSAGIPAVRVLTPPQPESLLFPTLKILPWLLGS
jgi:DNA-binding beta-propeller fold protein YncE